jgi:two-component system, OmpR family, alkaline phosphatase synthesis response regulator PhoP
MVSRVLYVEDDIDGQELIQAWLSIQGYQVTTVSSAVEGLQLTKMQTFDIYILDNWLKANSGIELCEQIRLSDLNTPIIFLSGAAFPSDLEQAFAAGAQEYLTKPVELDELYKVVVRLINDSKLVPVGA